MKKIRIVNLYNNKVGKNQPWQGSNALIYQAIENILWKSIIQRQVLIVGDMNTHSMI